MAVTDIGPLINMVPSVRDAPGRSIWLTYDSDADALYVHYKKPNLAVDTRLGVSEIDGTHVTYGYDPANQLTYEVRSGAYAYARSYVYDGNANRLQQYDSGALSQRTRRLLLQ